MHKPFDPGLANEDEWSNNLIRVSSGYQNIIFLGINVGQILLHHTKTSITNGTTWISFNMTGANTTFVQGVVNANAVSETNTTGILEELLVFRDAFVNNNQIFVKRITFD
jgi:hypothetical protein